MNNNKKKSGCGCFFAIIIIFLIAIVISVCVLYMMDPTKLQSNLNEIAVKLQEYAYEMNGMTVPTEENLQLPEEEELTEAQNYFYYQQLSEPAKKIYVTIENNIENLKNGVDNIPLPSSLNEVAKSNENGKELVATEFQNAWDAFITDRSEYFYLDSSKVCLVSKITTKGSNTNYEFFIGKGENTNYFTSEYNTKEEVEQAVKEVENAKNEILKNATGSNYDKILYIHDWIIENTDYDTSNGPNTSNIYGCLVNNDAICEGYARAFKYLLDELNIPCILISGIAVDENGNSERHAWNYVYIQNNWYAVDTTWDDPIIIGNGEVTESIKYKYFLKGKNTMDNDHTTIGQVTKDGFEFSYPELGSEDLQ